MTHNTDAERAEFEAWFDDWRRSTWHPLPSDIAKGKAEMPVHWNENARQDMQIAWKAARRAPAVPVPQFSRIAQKKLDYLLEAGEAITGYAIENKDGRRGAIDCHGFVYWWQDAAAPQQLTNHSIKEQST